MTAAFSLTALDALETPLDEQPLFTVEPRDNRPDSEQLRVTQFRQLLRIAAPKVMIVAVPNAQATMRGRNQAKREGAHWGFPDMIVLARGHIAFIEFKSGRGSLAQHQIDCLNRLHRMGFPVGVFRNAETAITWLRGLGFPVGEG